MKKGKQRKKFENIDKRCGKGKKKPRRLWNKQNPATKEQWNKKAKTDKKLRRLINHQCTKTLLLQKSEF